MDTESPLSRSPIAQPGPVPTVPAPARRSDIVRDYNPSQIPQGSMLLRNTDIHAISKVLGQNILTVDDLVRCCTRLTTIKVGSVDVTLEPGLIERLYSRTGGMDFTEFLNQTVRSLLCGFTGF